jgi:apolipoprotein N-acyltransferase
VLLNVSNIAWFGDSIAIDQHLAISRMRAIEFERPMLRSTNTGATVAIDHRGRVTHSLPRMTRGVLTAQVEGRTGLTPYARWVSRYRLWPLWIGALAIVSAALYWRLRGQRLASRAASQG